MALITSAATGNFSAGATWTGGVVPGVGDEARASTDHTVTIDVDTTCDEVSNAGTGLFVLADGVTLTANVTSKSTTTNRNVVQFTAASPAVGFIVGDITGATVSGTTGAVNNASSGTLTITGNVTGGSATNAFGCFNASSGTLTITGNVTGGSGSVANGAQNATGGLLAITGNVTGGSAASTFGARNNSTGTITISGIATGGTVASASGILNLSTGSVNLTRAKGTAYGPGNTSGLAAAVGAQNSGLGVIEIQELEYGQYGMSPTSGTGIRLKKVSTNQAIFNYVDAGAAKTLVDATQGEMPAVTDVRTGVSYASGALTGTCAVPAASSVGFGVPVDATTGTAVLTPQAVANAVWNEVLTGATHNVNRSAGKRLRQLGDERIIADGDTQSATSDTITLEAIGTLCVGQTIVVTDQSTGDKQTRYILAYNAGTNTATVDSPWCSTPTAEDAYLITTVRDPLIIRASHPEGTVGAEIDELYLIHGLKSGSALTVTPTSRAAGSVSQTIGGDGTTTTTVTRA